MISYFPALILAGGTIGKLSLTAHGALELQDIKACLQSSQPERKLVKGVGLGGGVLVCRWMEVLWIDSAVVST